MSISKNLGFGKGGGGSEVCRPFNRVDYAKTNIGRKKIKKPFFFLPVARMPSRLLHRYKILIKTLLPFRRSCTQKEGKTHKKRLTTTHTNNFKKKVYPCRPQPVR